MKIGIKTLLLTVSVSSAALTPTFAASITPLPPYAFFGSGFGPSTTSIGSYTTYSPNGASYGSTSYGGALTPSPSIRC